MTFGFNPQKPLKITQPGFPGQILFLCPSKTISAMKGSGFKHEKPASSFHDPTERRNQYATITYVVVLAL